MSSALECGPVTVTELCGKVSWRVGSIFPTGRCPFQGGVGGMVGRAGAQAGRSRASAAKVRRVVPEGWEWGAEMRRRRPLSFAP